MIILKMMFSLLIYIVIGEIFTIIKLIKTRKILIDAIKKEHTTFSPLMPVKQNDMVHLPPARIYQLVIYKPKMPLHEVIH